MGVKLLASTLGVIGGGGVTSVALWQAGYIGVVDNTKVLSDSNSQSPQAVRPEQADSAEADNFWKPTSPDYSQSKSLTGNCQVDNESFKDILEGLSKIKSNDSEEGEDFIAIICQNSGTSFDKKWTGFFPNDAFAYEIPNDGEQLEITTETNFAPERSDEQYRTTFTGKVFTGGFLVGDWGVSTQKIGDKELKVVKEVSDGKEKVPEYGKFYVLFQDSKDK